MQSRKHFSHLPNSTVFGQALQIEAKRNVVTARHFPQFDVFLYWMKEIGVDTQIFEGSTDWQTLIDSGNQLREIISQKTISEVHKGNSKLVTVLQTIEKYLSKESLIPASIDLLFIFGSKDLGRVHKAIIEIYNKHTVKNILIAGGARYDSQDASEPEADIFRRHAIQLGVPAEKIIIEPKSITIADNVRSGLNLLDALNIEYKNIATMVSWFAQKRAWAHLKKYTNAEIICVNSTPKSTELSPGEWYKHEVGISIVFSEFIKMKMAVMIDTA